MTDFYIKIKSILSYEGLPHKFICAYALACAKDVFPLIKDKDLKEKSLHCIDLAERWIKGEDIKAKALSDAAYAATSATSAARAARATSATYAAHAAASYAAYSAAYAHNKDYDKASKQYYELLLKMIDENFTELEKVLILPQVSQK